MPPPSCIVRRWARSWPRETRFETSGRDSSFLRNSESNKAIVWGSPRLAGFRSVRFGPGSDGHRGGFDRFEEVVDDVVGLDILGLAFEVEDQAVPKGGVGGGADVFPGHV